MRYILLIVSLLFLPIVVEMKAQSWQQVYDEMMTIDDDEESGELLYDNYELMEQLAAHPLDLNSVTREELEQLPFLSSMQVMDIAEYLDRYGPMRSLGELRMIRSLDRQQLALLPFFVYVTGEADHDEPVRPPLDSLLHWGKSSLWATIRIPTYQRAGDKNGYLGYAYRHSLRYEWSSGRYLRLGLLGAQDAGEPFFADKNRWGYDTYSYYLQVKKMGRLDNFIVGKYKVAAGMGLVLGQSFRLGKLATLQSLGRSVSTLRPHSSRSESDYFRGVATTFNLGQHFQWSAFVSHRPIDATLTSDGAAQTLITSGYHRTPTEMEKKGNTHLTSAGTRLIYHHGALRWGATGVTTKLDRTLQPQRQTLFRRYYPHGRHFLNMSVDYGYTHHRFAFSGETAVDGHARLATINTLSLQPSSRIGMTAIQRFYSYRYTTLHGHSFGESTAVQNESGIYLGATWKATAHLQLQGYADYAYFPWARYQVSRESHAWDFLLQASYDFNSRWSMLVRHRSHLRQKDNDDKTALISDDNHRERIALSYDDKVWAMKTQLDLTQSKYKASDHGWMLSQQASLTQGRWHLYGFLSYFNTTSFQSRIYAYERQMQHDFYFPTYYGKGFHLALQASADIGSQLRLTAKVGHTSYNDRETIGSGLQLIPHSHQTDVDIQLRWLFKNGR